MKETNLFYIFGIIPYRYDTTTKKYVLIRREQIRGLIVQTAVPNVVLWLCGITAPSEIFISGKVWSTSYVLQMLLVIAAVYVSIFDNYYNAQFYMFLQSTYRSTDCEAGSSIQRILTFKIFSLVIFYAYMGIYLANRFITENESFPMMFFYFIYTYLECLLVMNSFYMGTVFEYLQCFLNDLLKFDLHQQLNVHSKRIRKKFFTYASRKNELSQILCPRLLFMGMSAFLTSSSMVYLTMQWLDSRTITSPWNDINDIVLQMGQLCCHMGGLGSLCYAVEQCSRKVRKNQSIFLKSSHFC